MKLISMTDFVLENAKQPYVEGTKYKDLVNYAKFLKQPLNIGMFVPCDEDGDILDEPENYELRLPNMMTEYNDEVYRYKQAKEKVLFEGFNIIHEDKIRITIECNYLQLDYFKGSKSVSNYSTIEDLSKLELELTENAIKQIGL